jgi:hypothetical protein
VQAAPRLIRPQCHGRPLGSDFRLAEPHKLYAYCLLPANHATTPPHASHLG